MLVYLNGEISYSIVSIFLFSSNLCCVTHLEQIQFTFFHLLRFPLIDFSLTVKAATSIFISGRGSAISSAKEGKLSFVYNLVKS